MVVVSGFQCKVILLLLGCNSVECRGLLMNGRATLFHFLLCSHTNYGVPDTVGEKNHWGRREVKSHKWEEDRNVDGCTVNMWK